MLFGGVHLMPDLQAKYWQLSHSWKKNVYNLSKKKVSEYVYLLSLCINMKLPTPSLVIVQF